MTRSTNTDDVTQWDAAYRAEMDRTLRIRIGLLVVLYLAFTGGTTLEERGLHPEHAEAVTVRYVIQGLVCLVGLLALRFGRFPAWPRWIGVGMASILSLAMSVYDAYANTIVERSVMAQAAMLSALVIVVPWGVWPQFTVATVVVAGAWFAGAVLGGHPPSTYAVLALFSVGATSVVVAYFLDAYRRDAYVRSEQQREEAEVSAALGRVAETLNANLDSPDMLERVNELAVRYLGCTWSGTLLWDGQRKAFRVHSVVAEAPPEWATELRQIDFTPDAVPLLRSAPAGELVEIPDAFDHPGLPSDLMRRLHVRSAIGSPIALRGQVIGVLVHGFHDRRGPFSVLQRRIARGIAHSTAVALENARLIEDLKASSRLKSEFVAAMSHELRTPLNVITGYSDLLAEGDFGSLTNMQRDTLDRIRSNAFQLMELINATLDLGRLEAGREHVELAPVNVEVLLAELAKEVETLVPADVSLVWDNRLGHAAISSDRVKLKTILKNLVGNALKFTERGVVEVRVEALAGGLVRLVVKDTGIGIADDLLPVVFDMFRQGDGSTTRRYGGVGLGLHIVRRLANLLGGSVEVQSAVGKGSTFTVTIAAPGAEPARATGTRGTTH